MSYASKAKRSNFIPWPGKVKEPSAWLPGLRHTPEPGEDMAEKVRLNLRHSEDFDPLAGDEQPRVVLEHAIGGKPRKDP
jgi:hypothetical protein